MVNWNNFVQKHKPDKYLRLLRINTKKKQGLIFWKSKPYKLFNRNFKFYSQKACTAIQNALILYHERRTTLR